MGSCHSLKMKGGNDGSNPFTNSPKVFVESALSPNTVQLRSTMASGNDLEG